METLSGATTPSAEAALIPTRLHDGIRLNNLSYRYPLGEQPVLQGINLHLPAGGTVAIVGDNGAGKTTLVKLLAGLYEPTAGQITIDGIDMARLDPRRGASALPRAFKILPALSSWYGRPWASATWPRSPMPRTMARTMAMMMR
ncbi:MAG: ATP-binding cassette domain-containing protein [Caldilineaceae bacterium]